MRYEIGTQFIRRNRKARRVETVIDYHITRSTVTGDIVKTRYVTEHEVMGQPVFDSDVVEATIAMGEIINQSTTEVQK